MIFDYLHTYRVIYSQFVDADSKSDISFALNNAPEAKDSCKVKIITAEKATETAHETRDLA